MRRFALALVAACFTASCIPPEFTNDEQAKGTGASDAASGRSGGTSAGGASSGGTGAATSGGNGGTANGGTSTGGASSGGSTGGIVSSGGNSTGGGVSSGGTSTGGTGASSTGGTGATAGNGTGGTNTGGAATGGVATGGTGAATGCTQPSECSQPGTVCQKAVCLGNQCGFVAVPTATPPGNVSGDCHQIVCSQSGTETVLVDPTDTDDGNECTTDSCQNGIASHKPNTGARCQNGTKYCDSTGACVECLIDGNCSAGTGECSKESCIQGVCTLPASGTFCNNGQDQCDGQGSCVDCVDNLGCGGCCFCSAPFCVQG
jgi:hypothetical protein